MTPMTFKLLAFIGLVVAIATAVYFHSKYRWGWPTLLALAIAVLIAGVPLLYR
jgi:hypothetical protein